MENQCKPDQEKSSMTFTREHLTWAAGLFEGEGSLGFYRKGGLVDGVRASLGSTDLDVLQRFTAIIGFGKIRGPEHRVSAKGNIQKPYWTWYICSHDEFRQLVSLFYSWFGTRRRNKADECLAALEGRQSRKGQRRGQLTPFVPEIRQLVQSGIKQADIARKYDCSRAFISRVASGKIHGDIQ